MSDDQSLGISFFLFLFFELKFSFLSFYNSNHQKYQSKKFICLFYLIIIFFTQSIRKIYRKTSYFPILLIICCLSSTEKQNQIRIMRLE